MRFLITGLLFLSFFCVQPAEGSAFVASGTYKLPVATSSMNSADLNGDGRDDLFLCGTDGSLFIYYAMPGGIFGSPVILHLGRCDSASAVDLNGDGLPDLLIVSVLDTNNTVQILMNSTGGNFSAASTIKPTSQFSAIAISDVNRDGKLDLVLNGSSILTYLGNGDGTFKSPISSTPGSSFFGSFVLADLDGDGFPELIASNTPSSGASIFRGLGNGSFQSPNQLSGPAVLSLVVTDVNHDGRLDIVVTTPTNSFVTGDTVSVFLGTGGANFSVPTVLAAPCCIYSVFAGDFNGDGIPDLFVPSYNLAMYPGLGNGTFGTPLPGFPSMDFVSVGNFDGTGRLSVASVLNDSVGSITLNIYLNKPSTPQITLTSSATTATLGACPTLTATVSSSLLDFGTPSGSVVFRDGTTVIASPVLPSSVATLQSRKAQVTANACTLNSGPHSITASYQGDKYFLSNTSTAVSLAMLPGSTTTTLAVSSNSAMTGQSVSLTVTVAFSSSFPGSGSVTFLDGTALIGSALVSGSTARITTNSLTAGSHSITATYANDLNYSFSVSSPVVLSVQPGLEAISTASGASQIAPDSIASIYGAGLAAATATSGTDGPQASLGGASVTIQDVNGVATTAPLFYVSPVQINFLVPATAALGAATFTISGPNGAKFYGTANLANVAPALFSANGNGMGVAAATAIIAHADGSSAALPVFQCAPSGSCSATPLNLGGTTDQLVVTLYGTGLRHTPANSSKAVIGSATATILYLGAQPQDPGLDQINILVPRSLLGAGEVPVYINTGQANSNGVTLSIK